MSGGESRNVQKMLARFRHFWVFQKVLFGRGYGQIGAFGIGYLVAAKLQEQLYAFWNLSIPLTILFPCGVLGVWFIGWLDCKLGLWETEAKISWEANRDQKALTDSLKITEKRP